MNLNLINIKSGTGILHTSLALVDQLTAAISPYIEFITQIKEGIE